MEASEAETEQNHNRHIRMEDRLKKIKAFAFDVDGVFTDGGILADLSGELYRTFDAKDAMAVRMAVMAGYNMAVITGGRSESIRKRFRTCGIKPEDVYLGSRDKMEDFIDFCLYCIGIVSEGCEGIVAYLTCAKIVIYHPVSDLAE